MSPSFENEILQLLDWRHRRRPEHERPGQQWHSPGRDGPTHVPHAPAHRGARGAGGRADGEALPKPENRVDEEAGCVQDEGGEKGTHGKFCWDDFLFLPGYGALDDSFYRTDSIQIVFPFDFNMKNRPCSIFSPIFIQFYGRHYLQSVFVLRNYVVWKC